MNCRGSHGADGLGDLPTGSEAAAVGRMSLLEWLSFYAERREGARRNLAFSPPRLPRLEEVPRVAADSGRGSTDCLACHRAGDGHPPSVASRVRREAGKKGPAYDNRR